MDTCPATRTGKLLVGMTSPDCLVDLEKSYQWEKTLPAIAAAVAEIRGGYVTHIDHKDPEQFFFLSKDDVSCICKFDDVWRLDLWQSILLPEWKVDFMGTENAHCRMTNGAVIQEHTACEKDPHKSKILALLKCLVVLRRSGELLFKDDPCQISETV